MSKDAAEIVRLRYKYRDLIREGKVRLPLKAAVRLIGPDCAYHLYSSTQESSDKQEPPPGESE